MIDAVVARLNAQVPDLNGRVEEALALAEMIREKRLPQHATALVIPLAFAGQAADTGSTIFRQTFQETVAVLLVLPVHDQTGRRALARLRPLLGEVIDALAGWAPGDELGVFQLRRGGLVSADGGRMLYQLEFSITDQLRITP